MHNGRHAIAFMSVAVAAAVAAGCASTGPVPASGVPAGPNVPAALAVPAGQTLATVALATGVQIYVCGPGAADASRMEWVFRAPEADLMDRGGTKIGKHYAGPTWEASDGSKVVGDVKGRDDGPDPDAIPWLLLAARSNLGTGLFGATRSVQRLETRGGKAPPQACTAAQAGQMARVPYTATYYFYAAP